MLNGPQPLHILSVSGGKDSTATGLWLREQGIPFEAIHMATGWENAATDAYVRDVLPQVLGVPVTILESLPNLDARRMVVAERLEARHFGGAKSALVRWCLKKAMFPSRTQRWCTQELKVYPARAHLRERAEATGRRIVNVHGVRAAESAARAKLPEREPFDGDCEVWRPILTWSESDVIAIHQRHNVPPNPLYLRGSARVGCWPCVMSAKQEIRLVADTDPARIDLLTALEHEVGLLAQERAATRGEELGNLPTFFQDPRPKRFVDENGKHRRSGRCTPIADVVAWSRTKRGSNEIDPYAADPSNGGCVRWGVCDAGILADE
jgi:3'-phosphoadenosine 5'-phosphosulfate sulfotransferase (PAPS reductase)/FAD synthetase